MKHHEHGEVQHETPPKSLPIHDYNFLVFFIEDVDQMETIMERKAMFFASYWITIF